MAALYQTRRWIFDKADRFDALAHKAKSLCDYLRRSKADAGRIATVRDREVRLYKLARRARRLAKVNHAADWPAWTDEIRWELGAPGTAIANGVDYTPPTYPSPEDAAWAASNLNSSWDSEPDPMDDPAVIANETHAANMASLADEMSAERQAQDDYERGYIFA